MLLFTCGTDPLRHFCRRQVKRDVLIRRTEPPDIKRRTALHQSLNRAELLSSMDRPHDVVDCREVGEVRGARRGHGLKLRSGNGGLKVLS
jgi:hypothetical protein